MFDSGTDRGRRIPLRHQRVVSGTGYRPDVPTPTSPPAQPLTEAIVARVRDSFDRQGLMRHLGATMTRLEHGSCRINALYRGELSQQHEYFHAGVTSALMDTAGGYAALSTFAGSDSILTVDFSINLLAPASGPELVAEATILRTGRTLAVCNLDAFIVDENRPPVHVAAGRQTLIRLVDTPDQPLGETQR
jgi:uncharacterized protein (TIGR00369 family)